MAHFELFEDKLIGEGSLGKVYHSRWHGLPAAAKQFNIVAEADEMAEMMNDIEKIKAIHGDYILQYFGTAYHNGQLCLITSYADKGSLHRALAKHALPEQRKPSIVTGLIRGMHYLKNSNVIHQDFKSPNVLLDLNFAPKICDFGLASLKLNSASVSKTSSVSPSTTGPTGTIRWMAPELFQQYPRYTFASDVYALGVVIWEIFTEKVPYAETTDSGVIIGLVSAGKHEDIPNGIPDHYKSIIKNCWHLNPSDRIRVEDINKINEEALPQADTTQWDDAFDKDILNAVTDLHIDTEHAASQQQPTDSNSSVQDPAKEQERTDYAEVLNLHLQNTNSIADSKDRLASALDAFGDDFIQWITTVANQANNAATIVLGEMYYHGCGMPQDYQAAIAQFSTAAREATWSQGDARAQYNLGLMCENGQGVPKSDDKSVAWYTKAAVQGSLEAHNNLGRMYKIGRGVQQSDAQAVEWFTKAAEHGNAVAQYNMGIMYKIGRGVQQSDVKAAEWFTKAAVQGSAMAQFRLGQMHADGRGAPQSDEKAVEWYTKAAEQDDAIAQISLGWMYEHGRGVAQSDNRAVAWYMKAAEQGKAVAQYNLGLMYEDGRGVPQSDNDAVDWYIKAVEQDHADAQCSLGRMYMTGRGVPQNDDKAVEWYTKAAAQGNAEAQYNLGVLYEHGQGVPQSDEKATEWFKKAAEQGIIMAQYKLGWMYRDGQGVPQSYEIAAEWHTKAAEQGHADSQAALAWLYKEGRGVPQSDIKAAEWFMKAANQGNENAQLNMGTLHEMGEGVPQSDEKAAEWYMKAAEQGYAEAQVRLGWLYCKGRGVPQSDAKAVAWWLKAADQEHATAQLGLALLYAEGRGLPKAEEQGDTDVVATRHS